MTTPKATATKQPKKHMLHTHTRKGNELQMENKKNPVINAAEKTRELSEKIEQYAKDYPNDTNIVALSLFRHGDVLECYTLGNHQNVMGALARGAVSYVHRNAPNANFELYLLSVFCNDIMRRMQEVAAANNIQFDLNNISKNLNEHPHTFLY